MVIRWFMLSVKLPVNNRLLIVKFWGNQKLHADWQMCWGSTPLTPKIHYCIDWLLLHYNSDQDLVCYNIYAR